MSRLVLPGEWIIAGATFRRWRPVTVRADSFDSLNSAVLLDVRLPPGSGGGSLIDRAKLRAYGLDAATAYRGYLSAAYHWNEHGTRLGRRIQPTLPRVKRNPDGLVIDQAGKVIREPGGRPTRNPYHARAVPAGRLRRQPRRREIRDSCECSRRTTWRG